MRRARLKIKEVAEQKHVSMRQLHLRSEIALSRIADVLDCDVCDLFETEGIKEP
jgi:hypothetical protein